MCSEGGETAMSHVLLGWVIRHESYVARVERPSLVVCSEGGKSLMSHV